MARTPLLDKNGISQGQAKNGRKDNPHLWKTPQNIKNIKKTQKSVSIRIKRITLGGITRIDIRRCYNGHPSKSGISLPLEKIEEIFEAIRGLGEEEVFVD